MVLVQLPSNRNLRMKLALCPGSSSSLIGSLGLAALERVGPMFGGVGIMGDSGKEVLKPPPWDTGEQQLHRESGRPPGRRGGLKICDFQFLPNHYGGNKI
jgi:hypothetical protein